MITLMLHLLWCVAMGAAPAGLSVNAPPNDGGLSLVVEWDAVEGAPGYALVRATEPDGPYRIVSAEIPATQTRLVDTVTSDAASSPPAQVYHYRVLTLDAAMPTFEPPSEEATPGTAQAAFLLQHLDASAPVEGRPRASWLHLKVGRLFMLGLIIAVGVLMAVFTAQARQGAEIFIRRIPGIDAIEEGIGRATEMGRPVLYVPGIDELQDIQTIASMLILGQVSQTIATYQADVIVSCCIPIVREVADEVVRAGFYQAGHPDATNRAMSGSSHPNSSRLQPGPTGSSCARSQPQTSILGASSPSLSSWPRRDTSTARSKLPGPPKQANCPSSSRPVTTRLSAKSCLPSAPICRVTRGS